ncbi:MAG: sulfatase-like hydrolase/transferase [Planctomycetota bacterium]
MRPVHAILFALLAPLLSACGGKPEATHSGILITVDTTNRNALGLYGEKPRITPHLDALAERCLVYENARAAAPLTLPSHASMMTGLYPLRHSVRDNGYRPLPPSATTLAERARAEGFQTAAFVSAVVLSAPYGLDQGFDVYDAPAGSSSRDQIHMLERKAGAVTRAALSWLAQRDRNRPFFLWVHYFDPHAPYEADPEFVEQVAGTAPPAIAPYLAEVAQADAAIGELLLALDREKVLEDALLAVVADHGESLGRHGEPTHSVFIYDATIRVPLLLHDPGGARAGERSDEQVSVADLFPTFIRGMGLGEPGPVDGMNLFRARIPADRGVYFESCSGYLSYGWSPLSGWADARATYLHGSRPELFLADDWPQATNVLPGRESLAREFRTCISRLADLPSLEPADQPGQGEFGKDLMALGYVGGGDARSTVPHPLKVAGLPNPADHLEEMRTFYNAAVLAGQGQTGEAIQQLRTLLESSPDNRLAADVLGRLLFDQERFTEVIDLLTPRVQQGAERKLTVTLLALSLDRVGQARQALELLERGATLWPDDPDFQTNAARLRAQLDR